MSAERAAAVEMAPAVECRQWFCKAMMSMTVVVAATKDDAKAIARDRFDCATRRWIGVSARPATVVDVERHETILRQQAEFEARDTGRRGA